MFSDIYGLLAVSSDLSKPKLISEDILLSLARNTSTSDYKEKFIFAFTFCIYKDARVPIETSPLKHNVFATF